jgi:hypothetical protein
MDTYKSRHKPPPLPLPPFMVHSWLHSSATATAGVLLLSVVGSRARPSSSFDVLT